MVWIEEDRAAVLDESTKEEAKNWIEDLNKEDIIEIAQRAAARHVDVREEIRQLATLKGSVAGRQIIVLGESSETTFDNLKFTKFVSSLGEVEIREVDVDKSTRENLCCAIVTFKCMDGAQLVLREPSMRTGRRIDGWTYYCTPAGGRFLHVPKHDVQDVFAGNVPMSKTKDIRRSGGLVVDQAQSRSPTGPGRMELITSQQASATGGDDENKQEPQNQQCILRRLSMVRIEEDGAALLDESTKEEVKNWIEDLNKEDIIEIVHCAAARHVDVREEIRHLATLKGSVAGRQIIVLGESSETTFDNLKFTKFVCSLGEVEIPQVKVGKNTGENLCCALVTFKFMDRAQCVLRELSMRTGERIDGWKYYCIPVAGRFSHVPKHDVQDCFTGNVPMSKTKDIRRSGGLVVDQERRRSPAGFGRMEPITSKQASATGGDDENEQEPQSHSTGILASGESKLPHSQVKLWHRINPRLLQPTPIPPGIPLPSAVTEEGVLHACRRERGGGGRFSSMKDKEEAAAKAEGLPREADWQSLEGNHNVESHALGSGAQPITESSEGLPNGGSSSQGLPRMQCFIPDLNEEPDELSEDSYTDSIKDTVKTLRRKRARTVPPGRLPGRM